MKSALATGSSNRSQYKDKDKPTQIRYSNITAAKGLFTNLLFLSIDIVSQIYEVYLKTKKGRSIRCNNSLKVFLF